jgi:hypothetical protein
LEIRKCFCGDDISSKALTEIEGFLFLFRDPRQLSPTRD